MELTTLLPLLGGCEASMKSDTQCLAQGLAHCECLIKGEAIIPFLQMGSLNSSVAGT